MADNTTLEELNHEGAKEYLGGTVLICILSAVGIVGNVHVILVYIFRMKPSNHRVFILCLAFLDLITGTVGMPFVVTNLRRPFMFDNTVLCKILTFYNFFICISSACILIVIAVDRYRKICVPIGKQMSQTVAKAMCLLALFASLLVSWPVILMYGSTPIDTGHENITGLECNVLVDMRSTAYPLTFNAVLLIIATGSFITLSVLYSLIGRVIWNHRSLNSKPDAADTEVTTIKMTENAFKSANFHSGSSESQECTDTDGKQSSDQSKSQADFETRRRNSSVGNSTKKDNRSSLAKAMSKFDRTKRTTMMLFWITIFFFITYIPYLVLRIASYLYMDWYPNMTFSGKVTFNTFLWCVFINNMANPIIYGFCDQRLRQEIIRGYSSICRRNKE